MPKPSVRIDSLLAATLVIAFWPLSTVALSKMPVISPEGSAYSGAATSRSPDRADIDWNIDILSVRSADILSAVGSAPKAFGAGRTGYKPMFRRCDRAERLASENGKQQPAQDTDNSPDPTSDIDESDNGLDDNLSADYSARHDQDTPYFSVTGPSAVTPRAPEVFRALLPTSVPCFHRLQEHVRERAPPTLG